LTTGVDFTHPGGRIAPSSAAVFRRLDTALLRFMRTRGHTPLVESGAKTLARSGEYGAIWLAAGLVAAAFDPPRRGRWLAAAALAPAAIGLNYGVKVIARRRRPVLAGLPPLGGAPSSLSFPSAHSTASFAAATAMSRIAPRRAPLLYGGAAAMAMTRPYLGMHYPSDVVAGAALGLALGKLAPGLSDHPPAADAKASEQDFR
jgi:membrane-associated phospholipid phosphatase